MPDWCFEDAVRHQFGQVSIAGIDEAGRGPLAGPVVAGAVVLDNTRVSSDLCQRLNDSKKLKPDTREALFQELALRARIGFGQASVVEIDKLNILQAALLAMARAVSNLGKPYPEYALVDGNHAPVLDCPSRCIIKGDSLSLSIAAASIVAKVQRDRIMRNLDLSFPGYGWAQNCGYGTQEHQNALIRLGVTPEHRKSFAPIRKILSSE